MTQLEDQVDEALHRQIGVAACSQALVIMKVFNHPSISSGENTAGHKQSMRFLECIDGFFLQSIEEPKRRGAMLDVVLNRERLMGSVKLIDSFGCSDHKTVEFKIFKVVKKRVLSRLETLDF